MCMHDVAPILYIGWTVFDAERANAGIIVEWVIRSIDLLGWWTVPSETTC